MQEGAVEALAPPLGVQPSMRGNVPGSGQHTISLGSLPDVVLSETWPRQWLALKALQWRAISPSERPMSEYRSTCSELEGSLGRFASAVHVSSGVPVTLRVFAERVRGLSQLDAMLQELFMNTQLSHPCLLKALDVDVVGPKPSIVFSEAGSTLKALLSRQHSRPFPAATHVMQQLLSAVAYLHRVGICHGEVQPELVFISRNGQARLSTCGTGACCHAGAPFAEKWSDFTPPRLWYRPHEELLDGGPTAPGDAWALGCVFGEMLSLRVLFQACCGWHQVKLMHEFLGDADFVALLALPEGSEPCSGQGLVAAERQPLASLSMGRPASEQGVMRGLLLFSPSARLTPERGLEAFCAMEVAS